MLSTQPTAVKPQPVSCMLIGYRGSCLPSEGAPKFFRFRHRNALQELNRERSMNTHNSQGEGTYSRQNNLERTKDIVYRSRMVFGEFIFSCSLPSGRYGKLQRTSSYVHVWPFYVHNLDTNTTVAAYLPNAR